MRRQSFLSAVPSRFGRFLYLLPVFLVAPVLVSTSGCTSEAEVEEVEVDDVDVDAADPPASASLENTEPGGEEMELDAAAVVQAEDEASPSQPAPSPSELTIGDAAPPLTLTSYVTGEPLQDDQADNVRVVEFWATWCGPCKVSMPHLASLQQEYEGKVDIVGVTDEDVSTVERFLSADAPNGEPWQDVITYRLATDEDRSMHSTYMQAAGQNGIPTAFIVGRDGVVEWIGHPSAMDEPLAKVVDGTWDRQAAIEEASKRKALQVAMQDLQQMLASSNWDEALTLLSELEAETGKSIDLTRTRLLVLERAGRDEEAAEVRNVLIDDAWDNAPLLNALAWNIALRGQEENLPSALRAAERSVELQEEPDASSLDTLARVYYEMGDLDKAIEWQEKAAEVNNGTYQQIDQVLEKYQTEKAEANKENNEESESTNEEPAKAADADSPETGNDADDAEVEVEAEAATADDQPVVDEVPVDDESDSK